MTIPASFIITGKGFNTTKIKAKINNIRFILATPAGYSLIFLCLSVEKKERQKCI